MSQNFTRLLYGFALLPFLLGAGVFFNASSLHAQGLQVSIGSATVAQGAEICVPVRVSNFTNILGMEFTITYDPARLTFKSVRNFNLAGLSESNSFGLPGQGLNQPGRIKVSWLDPNVTGITIANNTAIFEICFTAANADAATILSFASGFEAYDGAENNVPFIPQSGTITIGAGGGGTGGGGTGGGGTGGGGTGGGGTGGGTVGTGTFTLDISDTTVMANQPFCLNVKAGSFRDILGMEMIINYNATALAFDSITRYNLAGLNSSAFGLPGMGTNQPGSIKLSWIDPNVTGISIPDSTVIFAMCFKALTNNITTNVTFAANAEVIDKDENFVPFNGVAGRVVVGSGGSGGGGTTGPFTLTVGSATVQNGQQVCLPVTATNFTNILGMEFTITYDPTRLQFQAVDNLNLTGLTVEGSFGLPGMGSNPVGTMKVSWNDPEATGKSVANGMALFRVCFTATGSNTTTNVGFSNISEVIGAGDVILPLTGNPGTVTITGSGGGGGGSNNFALVVGNKSSPANQEVCLDVKVAKFTQILGMEFTVNYNPAVLNFARVTGFNLNGLNESSFGLPGVGLNQPGEIKVSWVDPNVSGVTITDSTSIFQVCFTPIGASGTTTPVTINPQLEIINSGEESIPVNIVNGSVAITTGGGSGSTAFALVVGNKTAPANQEVCLDVKVANFTNILGMEFTLNYNPAVLTFRRVTGFNLTGLNESSFGLPGVGLNQPGAVKVSWVDPNVTGVTLPDSTSIFMVCFTPVGTNGVTTPVTINPQLEITNANEQPVPATLVNGGITIGTAPQPGGQLIVAVESKTAAPNSDVCLNVSVENFNGIVGMEFNLAYNTDSLTFKSVGAFNLAGLNETNFGLPGVGVNPLGNIKLSWVDPNVTGITLTGKVNIFQVCFTVKANSGVARVRFDTQRTIEITNAQDQQVPRTLTNGFITIQNVVQPPAIAAPAQVTNVNCFGASTGAINITVSGGSGNYSYLWNYQNANTQDLSNIPAGTYSVTVTDVTTQLTATQTYTVTQPAAALQIASTAQNAACAGVNTGQISLNVTGGTGPYTYAWSNGLPANLATQTNLAGGTYQVTVTDALGCSANTSVQVGQNPAVVIGSIQPIFIDNGNDGAVNIGVSGGTTPYNFTWSGPGGYANTTEDISGLNAVGQYCVTVTDNLGCKDTACVNILQRLKFGTVTIRQACAGSSDGTISVNPTGGQSPYTFRWSNGSSTQNLSNLAPGAYGLTITDALNTSISGNFQVMGLTAIVLNGNVTPARGASGVANGSITLNVSGGDPGYSYSWSNGATTASVSGLAAGEYCVTVTDENGCSAQRCFQVEFQALPLAFNPAVTNNRCFGEMNGIIRLTVSGGVEPYFATFNDGVRVNANSNGVIERGALPAGTYTFVIADAQGTTIQGTANITQPTAISVSQVTVRHDNENAGCTGSITLALGGGTGTYNVRWNSNNAGALITNLCEGAYVPTVEDANGCVQTFDPIQVNTFGFTGSTVDNQCPGDETGDINLSVSGGTMPYTYAWVNSRGDTIARTKDLANVVAGAYRVVVREQSGNMLMKQFTLNTVSNISATVQISSNYRGYAVSCQDASDGIAMATGLNGIGNNYMYEWLLNDQLVGSQQRLQNAKAGVYVVRVTDQGGCMTEANITLNAPPPVGLNGSVNSISCTGARDGDVLVSASGGVPGSIYSYRWSTGGTGPRISFLPQGNYSVTVTDANSCAATAMFNVQEPQPLSVAIETTPATTGAPDCNGAARVTVTGGTRPYVYLSNVPGARLTDSVFLKLCPGDYILQLRDARGCRTTPEQITFNILDRTLPCLDMRTVISPDGDGANDNFEIRCIDELKDNRVMIFNQWGQIVFETLNYSNNWDGRASNGEQLPEGAYYFVLEYTDIDGNRVQSKGSITLLRQ